jgi:hypothetical protein
MESFSKYPNERFAIETDFASRLATGEAIVLLSSSVKVYQDDATETDRTTTMVLTGSLAIDGAKLRAKVQAGSEDTDYFVKFVAVTDANNTFEHVVKLRVLNEKGT